MKAKFKNSVFGLALILITASGAGAQGLLCGTEDRELLIQVNHDRDRAQGIRNATVMTLSDPTAPASQQLIGRFGQVDVHQVPQGVVFETSVMPPFQPGPSVMYVGGIRLNEIRWMTLSVDLNPYHRIPSTTLQTGRLRLNKLNGQTIEKFVTCTRELDSSSMQAP